MCVCMCVHVHTFRTSHAPPPPCPVPRAPTRGPTDHKSTTSLHAIRRNDRKKTAHIAIVPLSRVCGRGVCLRMSFLQSQWQYTKSETERGRFTVWAGRASEHGVGRTARWLLDCFKRNCVMLARSLCAHMCAHVQLAYNVMPL